MTDMDFQKFIDFREQLKRLAEESGLDKELISYISLDNLDTQLRNILLDENYKTLADKITDSQFNSLGYSVIPKSQVSYSFQELKNFLCIFSSINLVFKITKDFRLRLIMGITESENNFHLKIHDNFVGGKYFAVPLYLYKLDYKSLMDSVIDAVSTSYEFSMEDIILLYEDMENNIREGVRASSNLLK